MRISAIGADEVGPKAAPDVGDGGGLVLACVAALLVLGHHAGKRVNDMLCL